MNRDHHDRDLRALFETLRGEERRGAPPFARPIRQIPRRRRTLAWAVAGAAVALLLMWRLTIGTPSLDVAIDLGSTVWVSPTDFLLETPGVGMLRELPDVEPSLPISLDSRTPPGSGASPRRNP